MSKTTDSPNIISSAPQPPDKTQLDRIEWKLDQLLARPAWPTGYPMPLPSDQPIYWPNRPQPPTDPWGSPVAY